MSHRVSTRRRLVALLVSAGVLAATFSPAYGQENEPAPSSDPVAGAAPAAAESTQARIETFRSDRPVAPGVELTTVDHYGPDGYTGEPTWLQSHVLSVDLSAGVEIGRLFPGQVAAREPLTDMAAREGAVAAVNADYFDIGGSGAPWGVGIQDGELVQSPLPNTRAPTTHNAVMFTEDGIGAIGEIVFEGTVELPGGETVPLDALNKAELLENQIGMFTDVWGSYCRCRPTEDTADDVEVVVTDGVVVDVADTPRSGSIAEDTFVLVGREDGAAALRTLEPGDHVEVTYDVRTPDDMRVHAAMSGRQLLVVDGEPESLPPANNTPEPRTAIGFSADGTEMWIVAVDGRQPEFSRGIGLDELAEVMLDLGAHTALNLDGGGSTTIVARDPGQAEARLVNRPSDGEIRPVPTGLGMFIPEGSGRATGFWVQTALDPDRSTGSAYHPPVRTERVFPGLTRRLVADAHDETYGPADRPAAAATRWRTDDPAVGVVNGDGLFTARSAGASTVTVRAGQAAGEIELTVLDELARLEAEPAQAGIAQPGDSIRFTVTGYDQHGYSAPIEPADVTLTYDDSALDVAPDDSGGFEITAVSDEGHHDVVVTAGDVSTTLQVALGMHEVVVDSFDDTSNWDFWALRATGELSSTDAGYDGPGLQLDFDFTQTDLIRGVGVWPADDLLPVAGEPSAFKLWVHSEGWRLRTRLEVVDRSGRLHTVEPGFITESGWQQVTYEVPDDVVYPISLRRIFVNELDPAESYHGTLIYDELTAVVPREPEPAAAEPVRDPLVAHGTAPGEADWTFAVLSDAGISADDPDDDPVRRARRALAEIRKSGADLVIVDGGFVDAGTAENVEFARQLLDEELGDLPYHYVPGAGELDGGSPDAFEAEFGSLPRIADHDGMRFLLLDSSRDSYRESDWTQLEFVREQLALAGDDPDVSTVVVVQDLPLHDPNPSRRDQLSDRKEAATVQQWLTGFREDTGKGAAFVGARVGVFDAARMDGVPYVTNGPVASGPAAGFSGWSRWSVQPAGEAPDGLRVDFIPRVDAVAVDAPSALDVGSSAQIDASITQDGATVPVEYPMAAVWSGSDDVYLGAVGEASDDHVAALDPATGVLTALAPGSVVVAVTVNGEQAEAEIELKE